MSQPKDATRRAFMRTSALSCLVAAGASSGFLTLRDVLAQVRVEQRANAMVELPKRLASLPVPVPQDAVNAQHPKVFDITMGMMVWGVNGRRFDMDNVTKTETVRHDSAELWEFRNEQSMMLMAHSMHVHGLQFRVIGRTVLPDFVSAHRTVAAGLIDDGWKDTVLLMPGERIRLLLRFEHYSCASNRNPRYLIEA
jgi:FtsP/CotA-like multicopper oxidase with cupredoxin domain